MELSPHGLTARYCFSAFGVWLRHPGQTLECLIQCSTSEKIKRTPVLKLFRGEPAITKLDRRFTSYHRSSHAFATATGSGLHLPFGRFHPAHGKLAWLRVPILSSPNKSGCTFNTCFRFAFVPKGLKQKKELGSLAHSSIGTPSPPHLASLGAVEFSIYKFSIFNQTPIINPAL